MRVVRMSEFSAIPGGGLAAIEDVLQITVNRIVVGYFVPPKTWLDMQPETQRDNTLVLLEHVIHTIEAGVEVYTEGPESAYDVTIAKEHVTEWRRLAGLEGE